MLSTCNFCDATGEVPKINDNLGWVGGKRLGIVASIRLQLKHFCPKQIKFKDSCKD